MSDENNYRTGEVTQLRRIADALDLIIKMVKEDQERSRKYMDEPKPDLPDDVPFAGRL